MEFYKAFVVQLRQMFSWRLLAVSVAIFAVYMFAGFGYAQNGAMDAVSVAVFATFGGTPFYTIYILPSFVYSMSFAREWQEHAYPYWVIRVGLKNYTISKVLTSALAGLLSHFLGLALFVLFVCIKLPLYAGIAETTTSIYVTDWMKRGQLLPGVIGYIMDISIAAALSAAIGMTVSVFFPYTYVVLGAPLGIMLLTSRITDRLDLLPELNPGNWTNSLDTASTAYSALLYKTVLLAVMLILYSLIAVEGMKRRLSRA